jgi:hypothetical protein
MIRFLTNSGLGIGGALAIVLSYSINHSILWAALHGVFSWVYVIYFAVVH